MAKKQLTTAQMQAALDKFLEGAASKDRMYHATGDDFKEFDPSKSSAEGKFGPGIYMTPQTRYANFFASVRGKQGKNAQIMPVHTSIQNPYKIHGHANIPFNKPDQQKLQSLGHDGIFYYDDRGDLKEAIAFHPTQVKSAIGNRGTYDPTNPDITKAKGGVVKMAKGGTSSSLDTMKLALLRGGGDARGEMRATPEKRPEAAAAARALKSAHEFASRPFGYNNPPGAMLSEFLGIPDVANTLERIGYGDPLTTGRGMTTKPREEVINAAMAVSPLASMTKGMPIGAVIKGKRGNWYKAPQAGPTVEGSIERLRPYQPQEGILRNVEAMGEMDRNAPYYKAMLAQTNKRHALNQWVENNLQNYIKKQMGTPEDPIRALHEEGISHLPKDIREGAEETLRDTGIRRAEAGYPAEGMAQSDLAKIWENLSDENIWSKNAGEIQGAPAANKAYEAAQAAMRNRQDMVTLKFRNLINKNEALNDAEKRHMLISTPMHLQAKMVGDTELQGLIGKAASSKEPYMNENLTIGQMNPWIEKAAPETKLYQGTASNLGFDHVIDILKQDVEAGLIRPEQLNKISVADAVRRTHEFDQEMAKKMAEAQIKSTEGMPVHKEYPEGYKWIELALSKELPAGMKETVDKRYLRNEAGELVEDPRYKSLESALKYEGDTMGHCVGGYCPDVAQSKSRIYSLRSAKNEPHVTVETSPGSRQDYDRAVNALNDEQMQAHGQLSKKLLAENSNLNYGDADRLAYEQLHGKLPESIVQIKGKQNAAPKEDYLPYVQDFVKSGEWSDVGDIRNTGLFRSDELPGRERYQKAGMEIPKYLSEKDRELLEKEWGSRTGVAPEGPSMDFLREMGGMPPEGMARGGRVHMATGGGVTNLGINMQPNLAQMRMALNQNKTNPIEMQNIGVNEAPNMSPKIYMPPDDDEYEYPAPGGVAMPNGMPIGGVDTSQQPGQQLMSEQQSQQATQGGLPNGAPQGGMPQDVPTGPTPPSGNMLSMTPQGQAMQAMGGGNPPGPPGAPPPPGMKKGGSAKEQKELHFPPSPALMKSEIEAHAERMSRQMEGTDNPNKKTIQQIKREKSLPIEITQGAPKQDVPIIDWAKRKGSYSIGVPGDPSRGGLAFEEPNANKTNLENPKAGEYLHSIGEEKLESPVPMYGGKDYGAYGHPEGWASDLGASAGMFNIVKRLHEEDPTRQIYGHYHKMSPESLNHAVHMMDAVMSHHRPHQLPKEHIEALNHLMRNVATTTSKSDVRYPEFPGFENPEDVMFHGSLNSGMRKKLINILGTEKYYPGGKQKMNDIIYAMSHPELRNIETGAGGSAILQFDPTRGLKENISRHPTYGHDIPSKLIARTRYITPAKIIAPRSMHQAEQAIAAMGKKVLPFNQAKMSIIREPIDEQYINQMGEYETAMKKRLGYKKGGGVKLQPTQDTMRLALTRKKAK